MSEDPQQLLQAASDELQKGNLEEGISLLNRCLTVQPDNAIALHLMARAEIRKGNLDEALLFAQKAVTQQSVVRYVVTLAEIVKAQGNLPLAVDYYTKVLKAAPNDVSALVGLAEIYEQASHVERAIKLYRHALDQDVKNLEVAVKFARLMPIPHLPEGLVALEQARPAPDANQKHFLYFFDHYVTYKEWAERVRHNQAPYHSATLDESFFKYAADDLKEFEASADRLLVQQPNYKAAMLAKASCLFTSHKRQEADPIYKAFSQFKPDAIYDCIDFQPSFYRALGEMSDADLMAGLPPLIEVQSAAFDATPIIYLSCNYEYYDGFARTLLLSINHVSAKAQIHLHIMDAADENLASVKAFCGRLTKTKVAISAEQPCLAAAGGMPARCYYHAIRFIRLYQHLKHYNQPLWLMDVDALMHRDPQSLFSQLDQADVAFRARPGRWEPWNQYNASVIGLRPTPRAFTYLRLIAAYVAHYYKQDRLRWGIDQLAMYGVYEYLRDEGNAPQVHLLNDRAVDYEANDDGYVWCNSGKAKFQQLERLKKGKDATQDPAKLKYVEELKKYVIQLEAE